MKFSLWKNILPILGFSIFVSMLAITPASNFVQHYFATTNQVPLDTNHIDNIANQSNKANLTPAVMADLHVPFIKNVGQTDSKVKFYAKTFAGTVFVTNDGMTYSIPDPSNNKLEKFSTKENRTFSIIQENFENVRHIQITGLEKSNTSVNYFTGNNKQDWHTNVPTYDTITLGTIWSNINLDLKAHGNNVEKIFTLNPGADVHDIKIGVDGVSKLNSSDGSLLLYTSKGTISMSKPIAYQVIHGTTKSVDVSYVVYAKTYGFDLGNYDKSSPVVIDPIIQSTYIGGSGDDEVNFITLDNSGNVYVAGYSDSINFPGTSSGAQATFGGGTTDAFVSKLNPGLTSLIQSTYLGGSGDDSVDAITLDSSGNVYVAGYSHSTNFPGTTGGAQTTNGGLFDVIVSKLNPSLTSLIQSTYIGGSNADIGNAITLDSSGNVYVVGYSLSTDFPGTTGGAQTTFGGGHDIVVSKLNPGLTSLIQSTYLGGSDTDIGLGITLDSSGNVYVAGYSHSTNFPGTTGGAQTTNGGFNDIVVSKLNPGLTSLIQSTYLGGSGDDFLDAITLDSSNNVYVVGDTSSTDFPGTSSGAQATFGGGPFDAFVSKLNPGLTSLIRSTYLGGSGDDSGFAIKLGISGNVYVAGYTVSTDFPGTSGGAQATNGGSQDAFVSKLNPGLTSLIQSTYLGGSGDDPAYTIALDNSDNVYVAGDTSSTNFPGTSSGAQATFGGGPFDVFVSKLTNTLAASFPVSPGVLYGTDAGGRHLFTISTVTGAKTTIGTMPTFASTSGGFPSLAIDPTTGLMYAGQGGGNPLFYAVNPITGSTTLISDTSLGFAAISDMAFRSDGTLFASVDIAGDGGTGGDHLAIIDKNTGLATIVGPFGSCTGVSVPSLGGGSCTIEGMEGIAFDQNGVLYGATSVTGDSTQTPTLYTINTSTGAATKIASILNQSSSTPPSRGVSSLTFISGTLYGGTATAALNSDDGGMLITINPATGVFSTVGRTTSGSSLGALAIRSPVLSEHLSFRDFVVAFKPTQGPSITDLVAANPSASGYVAGATITVKFSTPTNQPFKVSSPNTIPKANIDNLFSFSGVSGNTIGTDYTGTWSDPSTFVITIQNPGAVTSSDLLHQLKLQVKSGAHLKNSALTSFDSTSLSPVLSGDFGSPPAPAISAFVVEDPNNGVDVYHNGDVFTIKFSQPTNRPLGINTLDKTSVDTIFTFSQSLGTSLSAYTGQWIDSSTFRVTVNEITGNGIPQIGLTTVSVNTGAALKNAAGSSPASSSTSQALTGSFGTFSVSQPVVAGGSAITTLPSGITAQITLPIDSGGSVTIFKTTAPTTGSSGSALNFLGNIVDIAPPTGACESQCTFSFTFTDDDLQAAHISSPSNVKIFHDHNNDGAFTLPDETLVTTVTPSVAPGPYVATAIDDRTSKFAIGGIVPALAIGGNVFPPPSFTLQNFIESNSIPDSIKNAILNHDSLKPIGPSNDPSVPYYPLSIDNKGYLLGGYTNTLQTVTEKTDTPVDLQLVTVADSIQHMALYTNIRGTDPQISDSDTYVVYDEGQPLQVVDPNKLFSGVTFDLVKDGSQYKINYGIKFAKTMSTSDIIVRVWNERHVSSDVKLLDAWQIVQGTSSQDTVGKSVSSTTVPNTIQNEKPSTSTGNSVDIMPAIKEWGGYSPSSISDSDLLKNVGINNAHSIPSWFMKTSKWVVNGDMTEQEFVDAIKYMHDKGMIK